MMQIGKVDATHNMYLPSKRAKATKERARFDAPPIGDRVAREAWMRAKQDRKQMQGRPKV
jgi:hypothetical protein